MSSLNVYGKSEDFRGRILSNFAATPFMLDGRYFASAEGFIQGIMWPEGHINRINAFESVGGEAKKFGETAVRNHVFWNRLRVEFGSPWHHQLIERAIRAKFRQNPEAMDALRDTEGLTLTHDTGKPESPNTSFPADVFCAILIRLREDMSVTGE